MVINEFKIIGRVGIIILIILLADMVIIIKMMKASGANKECIV